MHGNLKYNNCIVYLNFLVYVINVFFFCQAQPSTDFPGIFKILQRYIRDITFTSFIIMLANRLGYCMYFSFSWIDYVILCAQEKACMYGRKRHACMCTFMTYIVKLVHLS